MPGTPSGRFKIVDVTDHGCWAEATKTAYIVPGTVLRHERGAGKADDREGRVGDLPPGENAISLQQGRPAHPDPRPQAGPPGDLRQRRTNPDPRHDRLHDSGGVRRRPGGGVDLVRRRQDRRRRREGGEDAGSRPHHPGPPAGREAASRQGHQPSRERPAPRGHDRQGSRRPVLRGPARRRRRVVLRQHAPRTWNRSSSTWRAWGVGSLPSC